MAVPLTPDSWLLAPTGLGGSASIQSVTYKSGRERVNDCVSTQKWGIDHTASCEEQSPSAGAEMPAGQEMAVGRAVLPVGRAGGARAVVATCRCVTRISLGSHM
jgi:hypothetical protein